MTHSTSQAVIVGCGYVGRRLAHALLTTHKALAIVRSEKSLLALQRVGIEGIALDLDSVTADAWTLPAHRMDGASLFYLAPPPADGLSDLRLDCFLRRIKGRPSVFVYMSTTGVYGDQSGAEVNESTPVNPQTDRAHRRMSAEHMTRIWCTERQIRRVVLRVPGIYGPGRMPLDRLQRREPCVAIADAGISNRIHLDDLVTVCIAAAKNLEARGVYNVTDGNAISATEFMRRVAVIAGLPTPVEVPLEQARREFSAERLSFLNESRRVSNRRMLAELGIRLRYADIDTGIRASL